MFEYHFFSLQPTFNARDFIGKGMSRLAARFGVVRMAPKPVCKPQGEEEWDEFRVK